MIVDRMFSIDHMAIYRPKVNVRQWWGQLHAHVENTTRSWLTFLQLRSDHCTTYWTQLSSTVTTSVRVGSIVGVSAQAPPQITRTPIRPVGSHLELVWTFRRNYGVSSVSVPFQRRNRSAFRCSCHYPNLGTTVIYIIAYSYINENKSLADLCHGLDRSIYTLAAIEQCRIKLGL
jgi:hypothetical protein